MASNHVWQVGLRLLILVFAAAALAMAGGCGIPAPEESDSSGSSDSSDTYDGDGVTIRIDYPDSLTGGPDTTSSALMRTIGRLGGRAEDDACSYKGNEFWWVNGYNMTQFLLATSATWTCISENLITLAVLLPLPSGQLIDITDDTDPDAATGLRYTKAEGSIHIFEFFFDGNTTDSDVWVAWKEGDDAVQGKLVLTDRIFTDDDTLTGLRVDFMKNATEETSSLYVAFADTTELIGFRADVVHDLSGDFPAYTALGIVELRQQWSDDFEAAGIDTVPDLRIITFADEAGAGATVGSFIDAGLSLQDGTSDYGLYLFSEDDLYFFTDAGESEYVDKFVTSASYEGGRTADASALDDVELLLELDDTYFDSNCNNESSYLATDARTCTAFVQALFDLIDPEGDNRFGVEENQGSDPVDERSDAINEVTESDFLDESLPADVFEHSFTPTI